jgi:hypothetical protein
MAQLSEEERDAILARVNGGLVPNKLFDQLIKKGIFASRSNDLTEAGRMIAELLIEIRQLRAS